VPEVTQQGAIGLVQLDPDRLPVRVVTLGQIDRDHPIRVPGHHRVVTAGEQVDGQRSDTVILAHLAKGNQQATLVSLPRDSWVNIPAYTDAKGTAHPAHDDKLNAAFSLGGAALLVATVQQLSGIHVDHYVEIDFAGFQNMVSSLGGVDVCLTRPAHDVQTGLNLTAGDHHLDGPTALAFVRQRYGLPLGDIDRIKRQQQFLGSMVRKVESAGTLANPIKLNDFLDALTKSISVDSSMNLGDMTKLALKLKGLGSGNVTLTTMPLLGFSKQNGVDVDDVDVPKKDALFASLIADAGAAVASPPRARRGSACRATGYPPGGRADRPALAPARVPSCCW